MIFLSLFKPPTDHERLQQKLDSILKIKFPSKRIDIEPFPSSHFHQVPIPQGESFWLLTKKMHPTQA